MNKTLTQAIHLLKNGSVGILPTDTAFALSCRIDDEKAVKRLFSIKRRLLSQPTPILVSDVSMAKKYLDITSWGIPYLMEKYWPGALTIIYKCNTNYFFPYVCGKDKTVGVRIPNHTTTRNIIKEVGVPLIGTSANFHGDPTPFRFQDINKQLQALVDFVVPGEVVSNHVSTIIDCNKTPWKIIRQGGIDVKFPLSLFLDTSHAHQTTIKLEKNGKKYVYIIPLEKHTSWKILDNINSVLEKHHVALPDITHLYVEEYANSFTGTRVGISIMNALGYALSISINDNPIGTFLTPIYP